LRELLQVRMMLVDREERMDGDTNLSYGSSSNDDSYSDTEAHLSYESDPVLQECMGRMMRIEQEKETEIGMDVAQRTNKEKEEEHTTIDSSMYDSDMSTRKNVGVTNDKEKIIDKGIETNTCDCELSFEIKKNIDEDTHTNMANALIGDGVVRLPNTSIKISEIDSDIPKTIDISNALQQIIALVEEDERIRIEEEARVKAKEAEAARLRAGEDARLVAEADARTRQKKIVEETKAEAEEEAGRLVSEKEAMLLAVISNALQQIISIQDAIQEERTLIVANVTANTLQLLEKENETKAPKTNKMKEEEHMTDDSIMCDSNMLIRKNTGVKNGKGNNIDEDEETNIANTLIGDGVKWLLNTYIKRSEIDSDIPKRFKTSIQSNVSPLSHHKHEFSQRNTSVKNRMQNSRCIKRSKSEPIQCPVINSEHIFVNINSLNRLEEKNGRDSLLNQMKKGGDLYFNDKTRNYEYFLDLAFVCVLVYLLI